MHPCKCFWNYLKNAFARLVFIQWIIFIYISYCQVLAINKICQLEHYHNVTVQAFLLYPLQKMLFKEKSKAEDTMKHCMKIYVSDQKYDRYGNESNNKRVICKIPFLESLLYKKQNKTIQSIHKKKSRPRNKLMSNTVFFLPFFRTRRLTSQPYNYDIPVSVIYLLLHITFYGTICIKSIEFLNEFTTHLFKVTYEQ